MRKRIRFDYFFPKMKSIESRLLDSPKHSVNRSELARMRMPLFDLYPKAIAIHLKRKILVRLLSPCREKITMEESSSERDGEEKGN